jgi:hypothetical protein
LFVTPLKPAHTRPVIRIDYVHGFIFGGSGIGVEGGEEGDDGLGICRADVVDIPQAEHRNRHRNEIQEGDGGWGMGDSLHLVHSEDMGEFVKVFFAQRSGDRVYRDLVLKYPPDDQSS